MHEYGITQKIINEVCEYLNTISENHLNKVISIKLVVGELVGIIDESVNMYFDILAEQTPCKGAQLIFEKKPALLHCIKCNKLFKRDPKSFDCPICGEGLKLTDHGKEFYIESIEVE